MKRKRIRKTEILKAINKIRKFRGLEELKEIPKGEKGNVCKCPIARALGEFAIVNQISFGISVVQFSNEVEKARNYIKGLASYLCWSLSYNDENMTRIAFPKYITDFILEFDSGNLPEFEETNSNV